MAKRPTFEQACAQYVHRFTMEHVPEWARFRPCDHGGTETRYYAPQFVSDREWYDNSKFRGDPGFIDAVGDCYTTGQTWPLGEWLNSPFRVAADVALEATSEPAKPTYDELLEMLDNVSAALRNVVAAHGASMPKADLDSRVALANAAWLICNGLLRPKEED